jgi:hypothetical protein
VPPPTSHRLAVWTQRLMPAPTRVPPQFLPQSEDMSLEAASLGTIYIPSDEDSPLHDDPMDTSDPKSGPALIPASDSGLGVELDPGMRSDSDSDSPRTMMVISSGSDEKEVTHIGAVPLTVVMSDSSEESGRDNQQGQVSEASTSFHSNPLPQQYTAADFARFQDDWLEE